MSKKKNINEEATTPQDDVNKNLTASLERYINQYMIKLGWNSKDLRENFVETMTNFIMSGKGANRQRMINNYLEKGMQVLNLEINKDKVSTDDPDQVEVRSQQIAEILDKGIHTKKRLTEATKELISRNYTLDEAKKTSLQYLKENNKIGSLKNLSSLNEQEVEEDKKDVYLTNFKTFFRLYLTKEYNWTTETANLVNDSIINIVEKAGGDASTQENINRRLNDITKKVSTTMKLNAEVEENKNLDVSRSELRKLAVSINSWAGKVFTEFFNTMLTLLINAKNVNIQRVLIKKINDVESSLPSKQKQEKPEEKESSKEVEKEKSTEEDKE